MPWRRPGWPPPRLVLAFAGGEVPRQTRIELPTTLMVRGSTAPPAHA